LCMCVYVFATILWLIFPVHIEEVPSHHLYQVFTYL
jgi:hypothetical protein